MRVCACSVSCSGSVLYIIALNFHGNLLGGGAVEEFSALNNINRAGFILGCGNWDVKPN